MKKRNGKVIFAKAGGNASKNARNCKVSIPKKWIDAMEITTDERDVTLQFDGKKIVLEKSGEENER